MPPEARVNLTIVRELNQQMRLIAGRLPGGDEDKYRFSCEDGCDSIVPLTLAEYDAAGGAWLHGHKPTNAGAEPLPSN